MCPCGKAVESRTHIVGECDIRKEERDVLEGGMSKIDGCDKEKFGTLDCSEKTFAILGDRRWPQTVKQEGDKVGIFILNVIYGKNAMSAQTWRCLC